MKKLFQTSIAALALLSATTSQAWNYTDGDAILVLRADGYNNVEFNLGNISQFTNLASGATITVTNWNKSIATNTFDSDLTGVGVTFISTTSWTNSTANKFSWVSAADTNATVNNYTPSGWQSKLSLIISGVGQAPLTYIVPSNSPAAYSIDPSSSSVYKKASFDYVVSGGLYTSLSQLGGNTPFTAQATIPGNFSLWRIAPLGVGTQAAYVGTFSITANGTLTFKAGPLATPAPSIVGITRSGSISTVSFTTTASGNYSLVFTNKLGGSLATWPVVTATVAGDGSNKSLTHTNAAGPGYYGVVRTP